MSNGVYQCGQCGGVADDTHDCDCLRQVYAWADCTLDAKQHTLMVAGKFVHLPARYFAVLVHLLRRADELVTKRELLDAVWPGQKVSDASVHTAIGVVRRALKCGASYPIETVSTLGYRFNMGRRS